MGRSSLFGAAWMRLDAGIGRVLVQVAFHGETKSLSEYITPLRGALNSKRDTHALNQDSLAQAHSGHLHPEGGLGSASDGMLCLLLLALPSFFRTSVVVKMLRESLI